MRRRAAIGKRTIVMVTIVVVLVAAVAVFEDLGQVNRTTTLSPNPGGSSPSSNITFSCTITGQPGGILLRVLSDANDTPIAGAVVNATNKPAFCNYSPATTQTTKTFTTNGHTNWYSLNSDNNLGYSFVVTYMDHTYQFTANLAPVSITCATLYVPSGHTDIQIGEFQTSCPLPTTSSSSSQQSASLTWFANYGVWNYAVTLSSDQITQGEDITALFVLTNFSNQNQTVDVDHPLVLPTIYSQNGTIIWTWTPPSYNDIENITASQALTQQITIPTHLLKAGQTYILSTYPGIGHVNPGVGPDIGSHLELNQTITILA